ncbi:MAG TPA: cupin domain-containing protein [Usitatibacter sp.]|nr:cupin domain-containing protein [Usitatibacter sp.]
MKKFLAAIAVLVSVFSWLPASGQQGVTQGDALSIRKLAETKVAGLPQGELYWRIENFGSLAEAQANAGSYGLAVEAAGKAWLFTLGPKASRGKGRKVAEVGPITRVNASQYLLRINEVTGKPGATTKPHTHPGSEAFYVLSGEKSVRGPHGTTKIQPGQPMAGLGAGEPMQATSTGSQDLHSLVMFVLDADRPFSTPARF